MIQNLLIAICINDYVWSTHTQTNVQQAMREMYHADFMYYLSGSIRKKQVFGDLEDGKMNGTEINGKVLKRTHGA